MRFLVDYWDTLSDPAHLLTELTVEIVTGLILTPVAKRFLKYHDRTQHGEHSDSSDHVHVWKEISRCVTESAAKFGLNVENISTSELQDLLAGQTHILYNCTCGIHKSITIKGIHRK